MSYKSIVCRELASYAKYEDKEGGRAESIPKEKMQFASIQGRRNCRCCGCGPFHIIKEYV